MKGQRIMMKFQNMVNLTDSEKQKGDCIHEFIKNLLLMWMKIKI